VSAVKYELGFYIPEDGILHSHRRENLKSYILQCYRRIFFLFLRNLTVPETPKCRHIPSRQNGVSTRSPQISRHETSFYM
jgi:hypothetical protein